jgi:Zn-dependent M16 (insulinase) family peptidase
MTKAFNLVKEQHIPELNATAQLYTHKRTGARLLSIINDDENKVFGINFRTTPKDSTGVSKSHSRNCSKARWRHL